MSCAENVPNRDLKTELPTEPVALLLELSLHVAGLG